MNTKEKIIEVSILSFSQKGFEGTTLSEIAQMVGIQKPSMYNHFKSKNELYLVVAERIMSLLVEKMTVTSNQYEVEDIHTRLYLVLKHSCDFILNKQEGILYKRIMLFPPFDLKKEVKDIVERGDQEISSIIGQLYIHGMNENRFRDISERTFTSAYFCLLDGLFTESFIYDDQDFHQRFEEAWSVFWHGIKKS
ncbi:putative transcriptional regulator [Bacillus sp. TS-2]|nr:putative transcriptional regulator [Bacillus sp. TS-2]